MNEKISRKQHILSCLAQRLETHPGERISTAQLAQASGVSEAALYRHFPSKAKMFEGLISFAEETLFGHIQRMTNNETDTISHCKQLIQLILTFAERNPGITRVLMGDILTGETHRLRLRVAQVFDRLETQLKQWLREAEIREGLRTTLSVTATANLLMACAEGHLGRYVRSEFQRQPTDYWSTQWQVLSTSLFYTQDAEQCNDSPQ